MRIEKFRNRVDFLRLNSGKIYYGRYMLVQHMSLSAEGVGGYCRVGYTASKRVGNSCKRNYARRRLRCLFREIMSLRFADIVMSDMIYDYVLIARPVLVLAEYKKLCIEFDRSLNFLMNKRIKFKK